MKYITGAKLISEFVTFIKVDKDYLFFQYFDMPLVCAMVLTFTFMLQSVWLNAKTAMFICLTSVMTNGYLYPKIVLNIRRIPMPLKKGGEVYNTGMRQTPLHIF